MSHNLRRLMNHWLNLIKAAAAKNFNESRVTKITCVYVSRVTKIHREDLKRNIVKPKRMKNTFANISSRNSFSSKKKIDLKFALQDVNNKALVRLNILSFSLSL